MTDSPVSDDTMRAPGAAISSMSDDDVITTARGIVTGQLMIVDLERHEWQMSLALMMEALADLPNLGAILVPLEPHQGGRWINGIAPGCTMKLRTVAEEDVERVNIEVRRMHDVLYPGRADA